MKLVNLTPHAITLQIPDGSRVTLPSEGNARVDSDPAPLETLPGVPVAVATSPQIWGAITGLPEPVEGTLYVVSLLVISRPEVAHRRDLVAPGTGPKDGAIRVTDGPRKGQIEAVTRLTRG